MSTICLEDEKINFDGKWLSASDITDLIRDKISNGNMKFAGLASALEKLNTALENSHTIEGVKLVLSKEDFGKLKAMGGNNIRDCLKKAIRIFIGDDGGRRESFEPIRFPAPAQRTQAVGKCIKCNKETETSQDREKYPLICPECIAEDQLKLMIGPRYQDHYLG